jgi:hypothetical protein
VLDELVRALGILGHQGDESDHVEGDDALLRPQAREHSLGVEGIEVTATKAIDSTAGGSEGDADARQPLGR